MLIDIFRTQLKMPRKVCIVAPGRNGADYLGSLPQDYYQVVVSKAVLCEKLRPQAWLMNTIEQDWYRAADEAFSGTRIFRKPAALAAQGDRRSSTPIFFFDPSPDPGEKLDAVTRRPVDGIVRGGGTISGCAVQVAYNLGARDILLCGVDMSGDGYWDGSSNPHSTHGTVWTFAARLQNLLDMLIEERQVKISTISPTVLRLPRYRL